MAVRIHKQQVAADKKRIHREWSQCGDCMNTISNEGAFCPYCGAEFKEEKVETL